MRKTFHICLSSIVALSALPLKAAASSTSNLSPVYVKTVFLNREGASPVVEMGDKDIAQLRAIILDQERINRDEELNAQQLAHENLTLLGKLRDFQKHYYIYGQPQSSLGENIQTLNELRAALEKYGRQLEERNRYMILSNEQTIGLRARMDQLETLYKQVIAINSDVESIRRAKVSVEQEDLLAAKFADQADFLIFKQKTLGEKYQYLLDVKAELARVKQELQALNVRYQELEKQGLDRAAAMKALEQGSAELNKTVDGLKAETARLLELQSSLKQKDETILSLQQEIIKKDREIVSIKEEIVKLRQEADQLKSGMAVKDEQIVRLNEQLRSESSSKSALETQIADKDRTIASQQDSIGSLKKDISSMQLSTDELRAKYLEYNQSFDAIRKNVVGLKEELAAAQKRAMLAEEQEQRLAGLKRQVADLMNELSSSKTDLGMYQQKISVLNGSIDELNAQISAKNKELSAKDEEMGELQRKSLARAKEIESQQEEIAALKAELSRLGRQLDENSDEAGQYKLKIQKANLAIDELNAQLSLKDKHIKAGELQITQMELQAKVAQATIVDLRDQIDTLNTRMKSLKADLSAMFDIKERVSLFENALSKRRQMEILYIEKTALLADLAAQNDEKSDYYRSELKKALGRWQELNASSEAELARLTKDIAGNKLQIKDLEAQLEARKNDSAQLDSMLDVYQKKIDAKDAEILSKTKEVDQLQGELQTAQEGLSEREANLKKVQGYFFELEQRMAVKTDEARAKTQQIALLTADLEGKNKSIVQLQEELRAIQKKLESNAQLISEQGTNYQGALKTKAMVEAELKALQDKLALTEAKFKAMVEELQARLDRSVDQSVVDAQKAQIASLTEQLTVAQERLKNTVDRTELDKTQAFVKASNDEITTLKQALKDRQAQVELLTKQIGDNESLQKELIKVKGRIAKFMETIHQKDQEIARLKMQLSAKDRTIKPIAEKLEQAAKTMMIRPGVDYTQVFHTRVTLEETRRQIRELREELARKEAALTGKTYKAALAEQEGKTTSFNADLKAVDVKSQKDFDSRVALEEAKQEIKALKAQLARSPKASSADVQVIAASDSSVELLKKQLINARREIDEVKAAARDKNVQAKELNQQVDVLNARVKKLEDKIRSLKGDPDDVQ